MLQVAGALFDVGLLGYTYLTLSLNILNLNEVLKQLSLRHLHTHTHKLKDYIDTCFIKKF